MWKAGGGKEHAIQANFAGVVIDLVFVARSSRDFNDNIEDHMDGTFFRVVVGKFSTSRWRENLG
jgi:hypothetical protein